MQRWKLILIGFGIMTLLVGLTGWRKAKNQVEQDHYLEYAAAIHQGSFARLAIADRRLLPGLPWFAPAIRVGYLVMGVAVIGSAILLYSLTGSIRSLLVLLFPPAMLASETIIGTEMTTVFWLLLGLWFIKKRQYWLAAAAMGLGTWFRLIMGVVALITGMWLIFRKFLRQAVIFGWIYSLFVVALIFWNLFVFGDVLVQVRGYMGYARPVLGIWQLLLDIPRAISWGWWRQVGSGISYIILLVLWLGKALKPSVGAIHELPVQLVKWLIIGMTLYVFALGPTPFLEEFPRFLVPVFPLLWLLTYKQIKGNWLWLLPIVSTLVVLV